MSLGVSLFDYLYESDKKKWVAPYNTILLELASEYSSYTQYYNKSLLLIDKALEIIKQAYLQDKEYYENNYYATLIEQVDIYSRDDTLYIYEAEKIAIKLLEELEQKYKANKDIWVNTYKSLLHSLSSMYLTQYGLSTFTGIFTDKKEDTYKQKTIEYAIKAVEICEISYKNKPEEWLNDYVAEQVFLSSAIYMYMKMPQEALAGLQKIEPILEQKYKEENSFESIDNYADVLLTIADTYSQLEKYDMVFEYGQKAILLKEQLYMQKPDYWAEDFADSLLAMAEACAPEPHYYEDAEKYAKRSTEIYEKLFNNDYNYFENYIESQVLLAGIYAQNEEVQKADKVWKQVIEQIKEFYVNDPEKWVTLYTEKLDLYTGFIEEYLDDEKTMFKLKEKIIHIYESLFNKSDIHSMAKYAESLYDLANDYFIYEKYDRSLSYADEAITIYELLYKKDKSFLDSFAQAIDLAGSNYFEKAKEKKAIKYYKKVADLYEEHYKKEPEKYIFAYISSLNELSDRYQEIGENLSAIKLYKKSKTVYESMEENAKDELTKLYLTTIRNMSLAYAEEDNFKMTLKLLNESNKYVEKKYKQQIPGALLETFIENLHLLSDLYHDLGEMEKSYSFALLALEYVENYDDKKSIDWEIILAKCKIQKAKLLLEKGEYDKVSQLYKESFSLYGFDKETISEDNIETTIIDFVRLSVDWYLCEQELENKTEMKLIEKLVLKQSSIYRDYAPEEYDDAIEEMYEEYDEERESGEKLDKKLFKVFKKLFK